MSLVDNYLRAVALLLPKDKRDDIIEELHELILSRIEAREAELGRPLTDDEIETVLRQLGHPLVVAARYQDGPQHLVGPALYPFWMFAVKAAVTIQLAIAVVVFVVRSLTGDVARAFGQAVASGFTGALILIGVATVAAWLIERGAVRIDYFDKWRVRDLGFLSFAAWDADALRDWLHAPKDAAPPPRPAASSTSAASESTMPPKTPPYPGAAQPGPDPRDTYYWGKRGRRRYRRDYSDSIAWAERWNAERRADRRAYRGRSPVGRGLGGIAAGVVLLLWWVGAIHFGVAASVADFRSLGLEPGALGGADWAGIKAALYMPVLAYVGLVVTQGVLRIAHPDARRVHGLINLVIAAVVMGAAGWMWTLSPIASAVRVETVAAFAQRMRDLFSGGPPFPLAPGLTLLLVIVSFGAVIRALQGLFELVLPSPPWPTSAAGMA